MNKKENVVKIYKYKYIYIKKYIYHLRHLPYCLDFFNPVYLIHYQPEHGRFRFTLFNCAIFCLSTKTCAASKIVSLTLTFLHLKI